MTAPLIIAIDGPSASGKGTLATRLAAHFGLPHLDTGLLYRAVGWAAERTGEPAASVAAALRARDLDNPELRTDQVKFFVTASLQARAERRYRELRERGVDTIRPRVLAEMAERDRRDSERAAAPLKAAPDAYLLDTSDMDADAAFAAALAFIASKGFRSAGP